MKSELKTLFKEQSARGGDLVSLMSNEKWPAVIEVIDLLIKQYDTVRGVTTDKEYLKRNAKVQALEELKGFLEDSKNEILYAQEESEKVSEEEIEP